MLYEVITIIPPVKLVKGGGVDGEIMRLLLANVRTPHEREGDFSAQVMANATGVRRLAELVEKYGLDMVREYAGALLDYAESMARTCIARIPDGTYSFEDFLDGDGVGLVDVAIRLKLTVKGEEAELDFTGSDDQVVITSYSIHYTKLCELGGLQELVHHRLGDFVELLLHRGGRGGDLDAAGLARVQGFLVGGLGVV